MTTTHQETQLIQRTVKYREDIQKWIQKIVAEKVLYHLPLAPVDASEGEFNEIRQYNIRAAKAISDSVIEGIINYGH